MAGSLNSLERQIGRETPSDKVGNWGGEGVDEDKDAHEENSADDKEGLWDLSTLLKVVEYGVLCKLLVQLIMIIFSLASGLDVSRVILNVLSSRHCRQVDIRETCFCERLM